VTTLGLCAFPLKALLMVYASSGGIGSQLSLRFWAWLSLLHSALKPYGSCLGAVLSEMHEVSKAAMWMWIRGPGGRANVKPSRMPRRSIALEETCIKAA
jgi:hypothetical protein